MGISACGVVGPDQEQGPPYDFVVADADQQGNPALVEAFYFLNLRCPEFVSYLEQMVEDTLLVFDPGTTHTYGSATLGLWWYQPGTITMNPAPYTTNNAEMLIADLYHEGGHALGGEVDDGYVYDPVRKENLHHNSWDDLYQASACPTLHLE